MKLLRWLRCWIGAHGEVCIQEPIVEHPVTKCRLYVTTYVCWRCGRTL